MSEIQRRPASSPAKSNWSEIAKAADVNPLTIVPADCRAAVAKLWACNSHLLPSALALSSRVRVYLDERTLTAADVEDIANRLVQPERAARHKFAGDLLADLAALVSEKIKSNKAREECEARRKESAAFDVSKITGGMFKPLGD